MATFQFRFSDFSSNDTEMNFAQICTFQWTKVKRCFGRFLYHFAIFGFKNAKINFLKQIKVMSAVFIELKYR